MKRVRIIPVLLIKGRGLYKTIKFRRPNYIGDPINAVKIFNDKGVDEIVILDIDATKENRPPNYELISDIASECFMPMTYGGGITTMEHAQKIFKTGVEKIVINSYFHKDPSLITSITERYGSQSTVVSIDYKKDMMNRLRVFTHGGRVSAECTPAACAIMAIEAGAGEILLNSIDRDGTRLGYDNETIMEVSSSVNVPVIACGGAGCIEDIFKAIVAGNASAVAAGSMFVYICDTTDSILINYPSAEELNTMYERL